jgi:hypothetical protein
MVREMLVLGPAAEGPAAEGPAAEVLTTHPAQVAGTHRAAKVASAHSAEVTTAHPAAVDSSSTTTTTTTNTRKRIGRNASASHRYGGNDDRDSVQRYKFLHGSFLSS